MSESTFWAVSYSKYSHDHGMVPFHYAPLEEEIRDGAEFMLHGSAEHETVSKLRTEDISAGGIRITIKDKLESGDLLSIKLTMPYTGQEIACFAQVAWVAPTEEGQFEVGLAFANLSNAETRIIDQFVDKELEKGIE